MARLDTLISLVERQDRHLTQLLSDRGEMSQEVSSDVPRTQSFAGGRSEDEAGPSNPPFVAGKGCKPKDGGCRLSSHHSDVAGESGDDDSRRSCMSPRPSMQKYVRRRNCNVSRPRDGDNRPGENLFFISFGVR